MRNDGYNSAESDLIAHLMLVGSPACNGVGEGTQSYASQATVALGDRPLSFYSTEILTAPSAPEMQVTVDRGISTVTVPSEDLPKLAPPRAAQLEQLTMSPEEPDIAAAVRLFAESEGGTKGATPPDHHGRIFVCEGESLECRPLLADAGPLTPGPQATVGIKFLRPELIKPRLRPMSPFTLRELKTIGEGTVVRIIESATAT